MLASAATRAFATAAAPRILITGACGQIGTEFVTRMVGWCALFVVLRKKYGVENVIASDLRFPNREFQLSGPSAFLDVTDKSNITRLVAENGITWIIHLGALLSAIGEKMPQKALEVNVHGSENIIDVARQYKCRLYIPSTIGAFGPSTPKEMTPDETIMRPTTMYGVSKVHLELLGEYYHRTQGLDFRSCRYPGIISNKALPGGGTTDYDFGYNYTQDHAYELGGSVAGEGHGRYNSFVKWIDSIFSGKSGDLQRDDGSFSYKYNYTTVSDLQGEHLTQTVEKHAQVDYDYTVKDVRDVDIVIDEKVTIITPDGGGDDGGTIIEENTPETPILPGNAELPPVQDARPDAPVLPSAPVLPPVQDAHIASALPQTGVNWLTAIGLALSGMTLMVTGAFAALTGKGKKEQP